jgi:hypothetical protein
MFTRPSTRSEPFARLAARIVTAPWRLADSEVAVQGCLRDADLGGDHPRDPALSLEEAGILDLADRLVERTADVPVTDPSHGAAHKKKRSNLPEWARMAKVVTGRVAIARTASSARSQACLDRPLLFAAAR